MARLRLDLTPDFNPQGTRTFLFTRSHLKRLLELLQGSKAKTIKIEANYFAYNLTTLGYNNSKVNAGKYGFEERPAEIVRKIKILLGIA